MRFSAVVAVASVTLIAGLLTGCGGAASDSKSSPGKTRNTSTWPLPGSKCASYFGGGVAVAMCNASASQPLEISLDQGDAKYGSAVGIAQAMGRPLRDGD